jgi:hypothetical protein
MKKLFVLMCAALFLVGLSFGEASAVRLEFSGYYGGTNDIAHAVTGYFEYTAPGAGVVTGTGVNAFTTYSNISGVYHMQWGGMILNGTTMDARLFSNYGSRTPYDLFRIWTDTNNFDSSAASFRMDITNKIGTTRQSDLLIAGLALPASLNLYPGLNGVYGPATGWTTEYTHVEASYYPAGGTSSTSTGFTINDMRFVPDGGAAPVPEPATMLLLGSGLIGLAGFGRKKLFKKR